MHPDTLPGSWYVVSPGETLDDIARRAGVPPEDILELNGLDDAAQVRAGRLLFVLTAAPATETPPAPPAQPCSSCGALPNRSAPSSP